MSGELGTDMQLDEGKQALRTYLRDHSAGAEHAVQLLKALKEEHGRTALGDFAAILLEQVESDLETLEGLAQRVGADGFQVKELAGWLGDKLSRIKLSPGGNPFSTFEVLEFLSLGILGKRALWRALIAVSSVHPELQGMDLNALLERAELQYTTTEKMRLQMAMHVFS